MTKSDLKNLGKIRFGRNNPQYPIGKYLQSTILKEKRYVITITLFFISHHGLGFFELG